MQRNLSQENYSQWNTRVALFLRQHMNEISIVVVRRVCGGPPAMNVAACENFRCSVASLSKFSAAEHGGAAGKYRTVLFVESSSSSSHG